VNSRIAKVVHDQHGGLGELADAGLEAAVGVPAGQLGQQPGAGVEPESYESALEDSLTNLEGDTAEGGPAVGADFWRSGPNGAAGSFSSNAGRQVLISRLRADLPAVEVE
jgi:hypothetical protein